ncbi:MAG: type II toxin-antitoxin system HicB family antitoxin [Bacteroidetes bacterium]|nr:type II toxin-antitoxin system HicB family antitoxin [Bacteroidota bacterium]
MLRYAIIVERAADGGYGAYVPDLPGCVGMGATHEEALQNVIEAIRFHLDGMKEEGLPIPPPNSEAENIIIEYA